MSQALQVRDIHVQYGHRVAISGISLDVAPAQIVSLVGSNGAGKTSTLRAIMGLRSPSQGEIRFGDLRIDKMSPPDIVSQGIALSPEGRRVFPQMTVHDNLLVGGYLQPQGNILHGEVERCRHFSKAAAASQPDGRLAVGRRATDAGNCAGPDGGAEGVAGRASLGLAPIMAGDRPPDRNDQQEQGPSICWSNECELAPGPTMRTFWRMAGSH
jgi:branched-chain amino acid transport system ATP-binding protein